jgi:hypothetical protein
LLPALDSRIGGGSRIKQQECLRLTPEICREHSIGDRRMRTHAFHYKPGELEFGVLQAQKSVGRWL